MHYRVTHGGVQVDPVDDRTLGRATQLIDEVGPDGTGDLLLALATVALDRGVDPESALRGALRGYAERVRAAESDPDRGPQVNAG